MKQTNKRTLKKKKNMLYHTLIFTYMFDSQNLGNCYILLVFL